MIMKAMESEVVGLIQRLEADSRGAEVLSQHLLDAINGELNRGHLEGIFIATIGRGGYLLLFKVVRNPLRPLGGLKVLPFCHILEENAWFTCTRQRFLRAVSLARQVLSFRRS